MAGYSNRSVVEKLGVKPGMRGIVMRAPASYAALLAEIAERATLITRLAGRVDFFPYFASSPEQLEAVMPNLAGHLEPGGMLWVSWVKQTSPLHTGLTENMVRALG